MAIDRLVTGASGFVGGAIVRQAARQGYRVQVFTRGRPAFGAAEHIVGDILDTRSVREAAEGAACVIHADGLAHIPSSNADSGPRLDSVYRQGTLNVAYATLLPIMLTTIRGCAQYQISP